MKPVDEYLFFFFIFIVGYRCFFHDTDEETLPRDRVVPRQVCHKHKPAPVPWSQPEGAVLLGRHPVAAGSASAPQHMQDRRL